MLRTALNGPGKLNPSFEVLCCAETICVNPLQNMVQIALYYKLKSCVVQRLSGFA